MASSTSSAAALLLLSAAALLSLLATPVSADDRLKAGIVGGRLKGGDSLQQGIYLFTMQTDCNVVLYDNNMPVWSTGTNGQGSECVLVLRTDGNLIIRNVNTIIWQSGSTHEWKDSYYLLLQEDRNVVIYDNLMNNIWMTGTNVVKAAVVDIPHSNGTAAASGAAQNKVKELYP